MSSSGTGLMMPALLTRMSILPNLSNAALTKASTSALCETSAMIVSAFLPSASTALATSCAAAVSVAPTTTTSAPSRANSKVTALPIPRLAPVMIATVS